MFCPHKHTRKVFGAAEALPGSTNLGLQNGVLFVSKDNSPEPASTQAGNYPSQTVPQLFLGISKSSHNRSVDCSHHKIFASSSSPAVSFFLSILN